MGDSMGTSAATAATVASYSFKTVDVAEKSTAAVDLSTCISLDDFQRHGEKRVTRLFIS